MKKIKKDNILVDNILVFFFLFILIGYFLGWLNYSPYKNYQEKAVRWDRLVEAEKDCAGDSLLISQYNGIQINHYCYKKKGIEKELVTKNDIKNIIKWFSQP